MAQQLWLETTSVLSRVKKETPNCMLNTCVCVCHVLVLCVEEAFDISPSYLGVLLSKNSGWIWQGVLLRKIHIKLLKLFYVKKVRISDDVKNKAEFLFISACTARWLSGGRVFKKIRKNWE